MTRYDIIKNKLNTLLWRIMWDVIFWRWTKQSKTAKSYRPT